jgi:pimeloyl-ACP methyl ester carboxylesterase
LGERCRFLQYDYVGIGGSSAKTAPFNTLDQADELSDLLDALSVERVHLLGMSQGSLVSQAFLIRHPRRVKSFCGLGNPNVLSERHEQTFSVFQKRLEALEGLKDLWPQRINRENYARLLNHVYVPAIFFKEYADLSVVERLRTAVFRRLAYPAFEGTHVQTMVDLFRYYMEGIGQEVPVYADGLPQVGNVPILLLNGTTDTITPVHMSRELVQLLPGAELIEFEDVTHMGPMFLKQVARLVFGRYILFMRNLSGEEVAV